MDAVELGMSTSISEEEFLRLQNQLIELRTSNYSLEEQNAIQMTRNKQLTAQIESLEKELGNLYSSMKKLKNSELIQQNQALQLKLQAQEDEFRLQNQTLLQELSSVVTENEKLGNKIKLNAYDAESASECTEEVKKLRAESCALQRALSEERLRSAQQISHLKVALSHFFNKETDVNEFLESLCEGVEPKIPLKQGVSAIGFPTNSKKKSTLTEESHSEEGVILDEEALKLNEEKCSDQSKTIAMKNMKPYKDPDLPPEIINLLSEIWILSNLLDDDQEKAKESMNSMTYTQCMSMSNKAVSELGRRIQELQNCVQDKEGEIKKAHIVVEKVTKEKDDLMKQFKKLKLELEDANIKKENVFSELDNTLRNVEQLNSHISSLQAKNKHLVQSLDELRMDSEIWKQMITDMTDSRKKLLAEYENKIHGLENETNVLEHSNKEKTDTLARLKIAFESAEKSNISKEMQIKELEQQIVDLTAERTLSEKKGAVVCRDLKKQLAFERRRVEKLQDKIRDLSDSSLSKQDSSKGNDVDIKSISSWSLMSGNIDLQESGTQDGSIVAGSPTNVDGNMFSQTDEADLEQENRSLLERLTALQIENWVLEEKINHLEQGSAAMAEDLMKKSEIIKFYCMEGRTDPSPSPAGRKAVKKISGFLKFSEEEHVQESNVRMQRMLEETLTKNMYLQRDVEQMSKELEKTRHTMKANE